MYRHQCDPSTTIFHPEPYEYYDEYGNDYVKAIVLRHCDCCGELRLGYKTIVGESTIQLCARCVRVEYGKIGYA